MCVSGRVPRDDTYEGDGIGQGGEGSLEGLLRVRVPNECQSVLTLVYCVTRHN